MSFLLFCIYIILILNIFFNFQFMTYKKTTFEQINDMGIGYNLGKTFNCCHTISDNNNEIDFWGTILPNKKVIKRIKSYGFKTIRFQVAYMNITSESEIIDPDWIKGVKKIVDWIISYGLYCILCINQEKEFWIKEKIYILDKYSNFWKQIANEFMDYDEHLIFEIKNEIMSVDESFHRVTTYVVLLDVIQIFVDSIRNSTGFNIERLLVIPEVGTELEVINNYQYIMPIDPSNKTAVSINYYFPSEFIPYYMPDSVICQYKYISMVYGVRPLSNWGSEDNYKKTLEYFENIKNLFLDKGIPVIIDEAAILTKHNINNITSVREFIYVLFSLSTEYEGLLPCLWDNPDDSEGNLNYYNKTLDNWTDETIKNNIYKISRGRALLISDYYKNTTYQMLKNQHNSYYIDVQGKTFFKFYVNVTLYAKLGLYVIIEITTYNKNSKLITFLLEKEEGTKYYDGTTIFELDAKKHDMNTHFGLSIQRGNQFITINEILIEYLEPFIIFDFESFKKDILNEINK